MAQDVAVTHRSSLSVLSVIVVMLGACGGDGTTTPPTGAGTAPATDSPTSTATATTAPSSGSTETPATATSAPVAPTAVATSTSCEAVGSVDEVVHEFPLRLTSEIGADIRTGSHECFERIVVELQAGFAPTPDGLPGYWVRYADGPLTLGQTDDQFVELDGDADLLITVNAWMQTFDENAQLVGYDGPTDFRPTGLQAIQQLYMLDNSEGVHTWAVGLDRERPFRVFTLADPTRIVVDVSVG